MNYLRSLLDVLLICSLLFFLPFAWILRDGLGPESTTSSGLDAIWRCFMTFWVGPVAIGLALGGYLVRRVERREEVRAS